MTNGEPVESSAATISIIRVARSDRNVTADGKLARDSTSALQGTTAFTVVANPAAARADWMFWSAGSTRFW